MTDLRSAWWLERIAKRVGTQWTGKIALNVKDGKVLEVEYTEREREPR